MSKELEIFNGKIHGVTVSDYGREHGYLDYSTLAKLVGPMIMHNTIRDKTFGSWERVTGVFDNMVMNDFIISKEGYEFLAKYTDELVFYINDLDLYIWAIDHSGTRWDHVLTNTKFKEMN